jgi:hypothetical protein
MAAAIDAGKTLAEQILAKLPESLRASVSAAFAAPEATDALTLLGDSALARADYSRNMDALKAKETELNTKADTLTEDYTKLNTWFAEKKTDLEEYGKIKADPAYKPGVPASKKDDLPTGFDASKYVAREDFNKSMSEQQLLAANYLALQNVLTLKHYDDFKEVLDTRELLADKSLGRQLPDGRVYGLVDAYQTKYSEKLSARDKVVEDARIQKLVDEQLRERMKGMPPAMVPMRGGSSPLDLLEAGTKAEPGQFSADAAAAEYQRLTEARST